MSLPYGAIQTFGPGTKHCGGGAVVAAIVVGGKPFRKMCRHPEGKDASGAPGRLLYGSNRLSLKRVLEVAQSPSDVTNCFQHTWDGVPLSSSRWMERIRFNIL